MGILFLENELKFIFIKNEMILGRVGGTAVKCLPSAQGGSGRDPGVMGSSPTSGSSAVSLLLPLPLPLLVFPLSLAVSISVK